MAQTHCQTLEKVCRLWEERVLQSVGGYILNYVRAVGGGKLDRSVGKSPVTKPDDLSSIPRTCVVERENRLLQFLF